MPAEYLNRLELLKKLKDRYTHLQDHDTLQQAALRTLGLAADPAALSHPALALRTRATSQRLATTCQWPAGTSISHIYDSAGGRFLMLGALGAGKTTLLVELALDLLALARSDAALPRAGHL